MNMNDMIRKHTETDNGADMVYAVIACRDVCFRRMLSLELGRIGIHTVSNGEHIKAPSLLFVDADDYSTLYEDISNTCLLIGWSRIQDLKNISGNARYAALFHRPFLMTEFIASVFRLIHKGEIFGLKDDLWGGGNSDIREFWYDPILQAVKYTDLSLDFYNATKSVGFKGMRIKLSPHEWNICKYLYDRKGEAVSRAELAAIIGSGEGVNVV